MIYNKVFYPTGLLCTILLLTTSTSAVGVEIGTIVSARSEPTVQRGLASEISNTMPQPHPLALRNSEGEVLKPAAKGAGLEPGQFLTTGSRQTFLIQFEDQTQVALGPRTRLEIVEWTPIAEQKRKGILLDRKLRLHYGSVRLHVAKVYSPQEPFSVLIGDAAVAVRGTDFALHVERKVSDAPLKQNQFAQGKGPMDPFHRTYFIEAYTFEGEVHLASRVDSLKISGQLPREVVRILPGQFANLWTKTGPRVEAEELEVPKEARFFTLAKLSQQNWFKSIPPFSNSIQSPTYQVLDERVRLVLNNAPKALPARLDPQSMPERAIASEKKSTESKSAPQKN